MHPNPQRSLHSCPHSGSPNSSASGRYSQISSWGTMPTPVPSAPYMAPIPLPPVSDHSSPAPCDTGVVPHPALQQPYIAIVPPHITPYSSEPATHPPVTTVTLRLTPHPTTHIPSMDITVSSPHSGPLTVHDIQYFVCCALSRPIVRADLRSVTEQAAHDLVSAAFHARTANDPIAYAKGMCVGDRMGGAWCAVGVVQPAEPGILEIRLAVPRRR